GRLQVKYVGWKLPAGRAAVDPTPVTCSPARTTRSPRGPQEKAPASAWVNRQRRFAGSSGENAHTRPPAANDTDVDVGAGAAPSQPAGSEAIAAERVPAVPAGEDGLAFDVPVEPLFAQAARSAVAATKPNIARLPPSRPFVTGTLWTDRTPGASGAGSYGALIGSPGHFSARLVEMVKPDTGLVKRNGRQPTVAPDLSTR